VSDKQDNCYKALQCLYIALDGSVANDVNYTVKAYLMELESRVRELESCCTIEAMLANPNVNSLITQHEKTIRDLEAERDRLKADAEWYKNRDLKAKIELCYDDGNNPFQRETLKVLDVSVSENCYVVESEYLNKLRARHAELEAERDRMKEDNKNVKEDLRVCRNLDDTFWEALKPLKLEAIYVSCPGQHITDLISELNTLRARHAALVEAAELCIPDEGQTITLDDLIQHISGLRAALAEVK